MYCKVFTGRLIIGLNDSYHEVHLLTKGRSLEMDKAYIFGEYVYIYRGEISDSDKVEEGNMYTVRKSKDVHGAVVIGEVHSDNTMKKHHISRIIEFSLENIFENLKENSDSFKTPELIEAINNNSEIFTPTVNDDDDFLKYLIKKVIIEKKINLRNYKDKFASQNDLNNMKSGLTHSTKMSVPYFLKWLEVLGLSCRVELFDNGADPIAPLPEPVVFDDRTTI